MGKTDKELGLACGSSKYLLKHIHKLLNKHDTKLPDDIYFELENMEKEVKSINNRLNRLWDKIFEY